MRPHVVGWVLPKGWSEGLQTILHTEEHSMKVAKAGAWSEGGHVPGATAPLAKEGERGQTQEREAGRGTRSLGWEGKDGQEGTRDPPWVSLDWFLG